MHKRIHFLFLRFFFFTTPLRGKTRYFSCLRIYWGDRCIQVASLYFVCKCLHMGKSWQTGKESRKEFIHAQTPSRSQATNIMVLERGVGRKNFKIPTNWWSKFRHTISNHFQKVSVGCCLPLTRKPVPQVTRLPFDSLDFSLRAAAFLQNSLNSHRSI